MLGRARPRRRKSRVSLTFRASPTINPPTAGPSGPGAFCDAPQAVENQSERLKEGGPGNPERRYRTRKDKTMFAVIKAGGRQYRVAEDDVLKIEGVKGEPGEIVQLPEVLMVGGEKPLLGTPLVSGASVAVEVIEHGRGPKVIAFKKRRRKNSRRKRGHRQGFVLVRISEILTDGKSPSKKARGKPAPKPKADIAEGEEGAAPKKKAAAKPKAKAAVKPKAAAKKPAAKGKK
jgi:large subunit ribosomal protein L21